MILDLIGWAAEIALLLAAASSAARGAREKSPGPLEAAAIFTCAALAIGAALGVLPLVPALVTASVALVAAVVVALFAKDTSGAVLGNLAEGLGLAGANVRGAGRWLRLQGPSLVSRAGLGGGSEAEQGGPVPLEAVAQHAVTRGIPSVMEDPHLGPAPEPAELASAAIPVPAPWAALAEYIRSREPEDDQQLRMYSDGDAAGALAVADAYHDWADTCLNGLRLSPAYVAGVLEAGDSAAGHASVVAMVHKRFGVIYGAIKEWIGAHGQLPAKGDFLTEGD